MSCGVDEPGIRPPEGRKLQMRHFFKHLFRFRPKEIAPGIFLIDRDRDNWMVRMGDRSTYIYAPSNSLWSSKSVDFHGVCKTHWDHPRQNEVITPDEKKLIESALLHHLTRSGICYSVVNEDDETEAKSVVLID